MSEFSAFFAGNALPAVPEELVVSDRFVGKDGKPLAWKLQAMTEEENEAIRKSVTKRVKAKNGQYTQETQMEDYLAKLAAESVVFPGLKDAELQKSYGVMGAESLLRKMLLPGEYAGLLGKVQEINGFDKDMADLVDEVKN